MNGGFEEVLCRAVDEIADAVNPWLAPAVEAEVKRQLSGDPSSAPAGLPKRVARSGSGLRLMLIGCGIGQSARMRIALEAMTAVEDALHEYLENLVRASITRQRPISDLAQKEFDEWAADTRERAARYSRLAHLRAVGRGFATSGNGV
jgi:hypothetical protein